MYVPCCDHSLLLTEGARDSSAIVLLRNRAALTTFYVELTRVTTRALVCEPAKRRLRVAHDTHDESHREEGDRKQKYLV